MNDMKRFLVAYKHNFKCWVCKERINLLTPITLECLNIHHKNHNRDDNRLSNLKPVHMKCHYGV